MSALALDPFVIASSARRSLSRRRFRKFFEKYAHAHIENGRPFVPFHDELFDIGDQLLFGRGKYHNVIAAKELAKSVILCEWLVIASVCLQAHRYNAVQGNPRAVKDRANEIVRELTTNRLLREDFGNAIMPMRDIKNQFVEFNDDAIVMHNGCKVLFLSTEKSIRGSRHGINRPSLWVCDDPHTLRDYDSSRTLEGQVKSLLSDSVACLDARKANAVVLSNVNQSDSLPGTLAKLPGWRTKITPMMNEAGETVWLSPEECEEKRSQVTEYVWKRDYLCQEFDGTEQIYSWDAFEQFDAATLKIRPGLAMIGNDPIERMIAWVDPARGFDKALPRRLQTGDPDRAAVIVVGEGRSQWQYVIADEILEDSPHITEPLTDRMIDGAARVAMSFPLNEMIYENNGFQLTLGKDFAARFRELGARPIPRGLTSADARKTNGAVSKNTMIYSFHGDLVGARRRVKFSSALSPAYRAEWAKFRKDGTRGHDDGMDATVHALQLLKAPRAGISIVRAAA